MKVGDMVFVDGVDAVKLVLLEDGYAVVELSNGCERDYPARRLKAQSNFQITAETLARTYTVAVNNVLAQPGMADYVNAKYRAAAMAVRLLGGDAPDWALLSDKQRWHFLEAIAK